MWSALVLSASIAHVVLIARLAVRARDRNLAFLLFALGLRFLMGAFPDITNPPLAAGVSLIALSSLAVCVVGLVVIEKRLLALRAMLPLYVFLFFVLVSGLANGSVGGTINVMTKFLYLIVIQIALMAALDRLGPARVFGTLLWVFALPLGLQAASIALGLDAAALAPKQNAEIAELVDVQSINFTGPYGHESGFSMILLSMLLCLAFWRTRSGLVFWGMQAICLLGILFANYRTTMLAVLPILLAVMLARYAGALLGRQRPFAVLLAFCVVTGAAAAAIGSSDLASRFSDLTAIELEAFSQRPTMLTDAERDLMSGRIYIWSQYLTAYRDANIAHQLLGFGGESWRGNFRLYAHNTFVSFLYEFGAIGLAAFLFYWGVNISGCLAARDGGTRAVLLAAYLGFTTMNLATMPMWQIEGLIFLGLLNGMLLHSLGRVERRRGPAQASQEREPAPPAAQGAVIFDIGGPGNAGRS